MVSNQLAVAALAGTCVAAAAGGGYFATRHNAADAAAAAHAAELELQAAPPHIGDLTTPVQAYQPMWQPPAAPQPAPAPAAPAARPQRAAAPAPAPSRPAQAAARPAQAAPRAGAPAVVAPAAAASPVAEPTRTPEVPVLTSRAVEELPRTWQPPPPEEPAFRELVVPADSVIGLAIASTISSETAEVEDRVEARIVRDVLVGNEVAIPAGARAIGSVTVVDRGGRFREQAELGIRFHTLRLIDGTEIPVSTEAIYRLGNAPGKATAAKIGGGAVAGAILGGIIGGSRGAAIGATSGAGAGTAVVYAGDRSEATFAQGLEVTARFLSEVVVPAQR